MVAVAAGGDREADLDAQAAFLSGVQSQIGIVGARYRLHDG